MRASALVETDLRTPGSHQTVVRASERDRRPWLADAPVCRLLAARQIAHLGIATMRSPFEIVRAKLGGSYFLAALGGEGRVLVDGRWKRCGPAMAFLLPPGTLHAFGASQGDSWEFCWIRYQENDGQKPLATAGAPVLAKYDGRALRHAILGLHAEASRSHPGATMDAWIDLIEQYVGLFTQPAALDARLVELWHAVEADLQHDWSTDEMALLAHVSPKHLERLSKRELGRTPRQQLIWLRMRRAAELLGDDQRTVESVAAKVGYRNPFVFSRTFKRVLGWSPSLYPSRIARRMKR